MEYGAVRLAERVDKRRAGPGPEEGRVRALLEDPDDLLVLMMSSRAISRAVVMFVKREKENPRS